MKKPAWAEAAAFAAAKFDPTRLSRETMAHRVHGRRNRQQSLVRGAVETVEFPK